VESGRQPRVSVALTLISLWIAGLFGCSGGDASGAETPNGVGSSGRAGLQPWAAGASADGSGSESSPAGHGAAGTRSEPLPNAAGAPSVEPGDIGCAPPNVAPLFGEARDVRPTVQQRADGVIVTRGAGRVRGRHELEGSFSAFGPGYFENRSYAFVIEDTIAAGGTTIEFTYLPETDVSANGPGTNFRHWKIFGEGNVFHSNVTMEEKSPRELVYTATRHGRENRPMRKGDLLEFEFGIFIAGNAAADPNPIEGRNSYYSDTFRYRVGEGGLSPNNQDTSGEPGPEPAARLAGDTTIPWIYAEPELYFSQMALNMQPEHVQAFLRGRRLFHTDFGTGAHSEPGNDAFPAQANKLGPLFSARNCVSCHERDGRSQPPAPGMPITTMAVKLYAPAALGNQLQEQEGQAVLERYLERTVELADGSAVTLQQPAFGFRNVAMPELAPSIRVARQLPGVGLLEAILERDLLARADPEDCNGDGISGRAQLVDGQLGRIGWKAEKVSVAHQVADALLADMGVTSPPLPEADGNSELAASDFDDLVTYTRLLALPARRDVTDPVVQRGEALFSQIGCVNCHVTEHRTGNTHPFVELHDQTIRPYTDLLLHDMGDDLADGSGTEQASEWRTPPLWGLGLIETVSGHGRLLHDGRARSPIEAVLWHGGEAAFAREAVKKLPMGDREALAKFLRSL
jgi:CxxC motif-containing protein (DUF1111 family)